jgi:peptidoglycan/xylan/chitin deacetylase (PgdA/CDA1 family)
VAVIIFMYHRTPAQSPESEWDVPMPVFRSQVRCLIDRGCSFVRFEQALDERLYKDGTHVSLTFDDGHESNAAAVEFLHELGIVSTAFIVTDWMRGKPGFLDARAIARLAASCDFGTHGATHTGLSGLPQRALDAELTGSRAALEDILQKEVTTMSLPGGRFDSRVIHSAQEAGFRVIGSSVDMINARPALPLNRVAVRQKHGATHLADVAGSSRLYWLGRRTRLATSRAVSNALGPAGYGTLARLLRRPRS